MSEVSVINDNFILALNPPNDVFEEFVHIVSTTEGWAFQENDYEIWKNNFTKHWMFMVKERDTDKYVASISLARSELRDSSTLYTVAFFYCLSEYRSLGFGRILFDKIHSIYGDYNCFLFGVGTMWKWYEKNYAFKQLNLYFHNSAVIQIEDLKISKDVEDVDDVIITDVNFESIREYDKTICEMKRVKVIQSWLMTPSVHSMMAVDANGNCVGFGAIREVSLDRLSVSPMYADSPQIAAMILRSILSSFDFSKFKSLATIFPAINSTVPQFLSPFCDGKFVTKEFCRSQFTQKIIGTDERKVFGIRHCAHGYV